ncbi:MAG: chemotaxis protein CheW, partial [bacterium]|nr:chemotaxis protein CheW [bacterium]
MSRDARYEQIMAQRAEQLAKSEQEDARCVAFRVAVVEIGEVQLGIPMDHLREIVPAPPAAKLPGMTGWLLGLVQIRGELMSLIDTGSVLRSTGSQRFRLVAVVESTQGPLALAVDRVIGLRDIFT